MARPRVRPPIADAEAVNRICERLIAGQSMKQATAPEDVPSDTEVYLEMARNEEFRAVIARAREAQQHAVIDSTIDLADEADADNHQAIKLRIWARQWRASKLLPKVYGDKVQTEGPGPNGEHTTRVVLDWAKPAAPDGDDA